MREIILPMRQGSNFVGTEEELLALMKDSLKHYIEDSLWFYNINESTSMTEQEIININESQLSIFTGISLTTINKWFDPESVAVPKSDSLIKMAKYFNCTVDYLLDLSDRRVE